MNTNNIESNLQLITPTKDDYFLTGNPEITFFKSVYRRHTHFASQLKEFNFNTPVNFGLISSLNLPKYADLLHKIYLKFIIPEISIPNNSEELIEYKQELLNNINHYKQLYNMFIQLYNYNLMSYNNIYELYQNNNYNISLIYRIINNNTLQFETIEENINGENMKIYIYLNQQLSLDDKFKNIIDLTNNNELLNITNPYTYGNYKATLTMSKDNIQSLLGDNEQSIENILKILNNIIHTMNLLDKRFIKIITDLTKEYEKKNNYKFAWVKYLGHNLINYIEIKIGENVIDKLYGQWINIWWELTGNKNHEDNYLNLIGDNEILTFYNEDIKPETIIYVPIPFWFCRNVGLSLPILSLNYTDIIFKVNFRKFNEVCYSDYNKTYLDDYAENNNLNLQCSLIGEFYYLDREERNKFARSIHEYLIEQVQYNKEIIVPNRSNSQKLNFLHPTKGIVWNVQLLDNLNNNENNEYCKYTIYDKLLTHSSIMIENEFIADNIESNYYNYLQPYEHINNSCNENIYSYWFSLYPNEKQPTGTCNFSNIRNLLLKFNIDEEIYNEQKDIKRKKLIDNLNPNLSEEDKEEALNNIEDEVNSLCYVLNIYALNYNILRIANGFGKITFK